MYFSRARTAVDILFPLAGYVLWPVVLGVLGFLYGFYDFVSGRTGEVCLVFVIVTAICLLGLFWKYARRAGIVVYQLSILTLSIGAFIGSHPQLYRSLLYGWIACGLLGGIMLSIPRTSKQSSNTAWHRFRVGCWLVLALQAGLVMAGFARLVLVEERPLVSFRVLGNPLLEALAFSPDGDTLATVGGFGAQLKMPGLWDVNTGRKRTDTVDSEMPGDPKWASLHFIGNRLALAICANGHVGIEIWSIGKREADSRYEWADEICGGAATFSRDGTQFVYGNFAGHVKVFDLNQGKLTIDLPRMNERINCVTVSRSHDKMACASHGNTIEIWELLNSCQIATLNSTGNVECLDFSEDGSLLVCGTGAGTVDIFDIGEQRRNITVPCFHNGIVSAVAFSPNGRKVACSGLYGVTVLIDPKSGTICNKLRMWGAWDIPCVSFSADSKKLATGNLRGDIAIWGLVDEARGN